ncbi:hypothetical protein H4684_003598 [Desulfomicrobium macestii]|uniref:Uncharacterized protein n=1 Tax=Desulfomicrobium macestii TaxID=90731 RepID=A0ABR9H868_9BACT|nr:hypothetical protein [Desulfomicrobium macestii]MBE1426916.1 hypothetical protein [Desulfomicrobium macestii]
MPWSFFLLKIPHTTSSSNNIKQEDVIEGNVEKSSGVITTDEELESYRIVRAIGAEYVDTDRITLRDAKSYCAILLDNNNRRPICRLYFGKSKKSLSIFVPDNEMRVDISKISEIYKYRAELGLAIKQYDK